MEARLLRLAKFVYRRTPWARLRRLGFELFLRVNRGRRVVATREGLTFDLDLGELIDVALFLGEYERDMAVAIDRLAEPGSCVLDVGANVGAHTLRLARRVGASGRVYAFEPTAYAFAKLGRNLSLNSFPQVEAVRLALSDHDETDGVIAARSSWRTDGYQAPAAEAVPFARLDTWCANRQVPGVSLAKIDVDGHEFSVLSGGRETLERQRPILLIEAGHYHYERADRNPFTLLESLGYGFWDTRTRQRFATAAALGDALLVDRARAIDSRNVVAATARDLRW